MSTVEIGKQKPFIVLITFHILSACIVLTNELLAINNRVPGGNFPIEHKFSWARVLLFCAVAMISAIVVWFFTTRKDLRISLPSFKFVLPVAILLTLISVLINYPSVSGWCCEVYPTRYFGFPFSYLRGDGLLDEVSLIFKVRTVMRSRLYVPYQFFLNLLFWSNVVFLVFGLAPFGVQKGKATKEAENVTRPERPLLTDRIIRLFLAIFFGIIAGMIALLPARSAAPPIPEATPFLSTPTPIFTATSASTPSQRLLMLASASTPTLEQPFVSTPTPAIVTEVACPNTQPVGAAIGQIAMVRLDPSVPSQVHEQPDAQSTVLGKLRTDEFFIILDGPQCTDGYIWWKVQSARGLLGWIADGYVSSYWLVTPTPVSTKLIDTPMPLSTPWLTPTATSIQPTAVSAAQLYRVLISDDISISIAWSQDGAHLASIGSRGNGGVGTTGPDQSIRIWDWAQGQQLSAANIGGKNITDVDWSPDRKQAVSAESMEVRGSLNGELLAQMDTSNLICRDASWSPNGHLLAGGCDDGSIFIWDAATGEQLRKLYGHVEAVTDIAWSPNGQQIASSSFDGTLQIWDVIGGKQISILRNEVKCRGDFPCGINSIAWSPDTSQIAFGDNNTDIKIWNLISGQLRSIGHPVSSSISVSALAWSPDGRRLVSIGGDGIYIWDLIDGSFSCTLDPGDIHQAFEVAWSPDGEYLAVAGGSRSEPHKGLIWVWSIP